ncbi:glycoside hydrolase family 18 protein [Tenacibaculum xiamenense]|uniref:glycoside hydrolase family 18 protein n=1 Tax=Tenacibaculum xiamenense TaxID=1261553 RepID=UPI0038965D1B
MSNVESKLVTYYNASGVPLEKAAELPYTTVNLAFLYTSYDAPLTLKLGGAIAARDTPPVLTETTKNAVSKIQNAGKKVLISFGGGDMGYEAYAQLVGKEKELGTAIASFIKDNNLNGIDIDYEDTAGFNGTAGYNGAQFLIDLTKALREELPNSDYIITHAPQPPYFEPEKYGYTTGAYAKIMEEVGNLIDWLNVQFYNNPPWSGNPPQIVSSYEQFSKLPGITAEKLLIGLPVTKNDASPESYIPINTIITEIIEPIQNNGTLGGMMNWQFSSDVGGDWAKRIGSALSLVPQNA